MSTVTLSTCQVAGALATLAVADCFGLEIDVATGDNLGRCCIQSSNGPGGAAQQFSLVTLRVQPMLEVPN